MSRIMAGRRGTITRTIILQTLKQHPQLIKGKQIHTLTSTTQQAPFHHRPQNLEHAQQRPVYSQPTDVRIEPQQRHLLYKFLLPTQPSVYLSQTLYPIGGFPQKLIVAFYITVHYGIVHVADRDTFLLQPVAEQCIFMSISADAFIKWDGLHHPSMHNKVVSHKRSVRMLASLTGIVALAPHPVHIPQVMLTVVTLAVIHSPPAKHTLNRFMLNSINVFRQKALPHYRVAIQKQQIVILGISQKQVADSCPADILLQLHIPPPFRKLPVYNSVLLVRMVVNTNQLARHIQAFHLPPQSLRSAPHVAVEYRYAD